MNENKRIKNERDANLELVKERDNKSNDLNDTLLAIARSGVTLNELNDPWNEFGSRK